MEGLEAVKGEVHSLGIEIAGLKPLVHEVHSNMPRITTALETLARVSERLEANAEDHKRIHYRITETESDLKDLSGRHDDLERQFDSLRDEHIVFTTTSKVRQSDAQSGLWARLKIKAAEKTMEIVLLAVLGFLVWGIIFHLPKYPVTAPIIEAGQKGESK